MSEDELKKILIAEDEQDIRDIEKMALEMLGSFQVEVCCNGTEVMEKALSYKPQLILLDVMMPEMDGPQAFVELCQNEGTKNIPVIFVTAKAMESEIERLVALGAKGVITKPFDPATFSQQVLKIWEES
jgi:CheY-like chemotaxis protein